MRHDPRPAASRPFPRTATYFRYGLLLLYCLLLAGCSLPGPQPARPTVDGGVRVGNQYLLEASLAGEEREFQAADGSNLGYIAYTGPGADTALVYLHGVESHAGWFAQAASLLRARGYDVFCLDRRGSGINRENRGFTSGHIDQYQVLLEDIHTFIAPLRERYRRIILTGLSWGGKLATAHALTYPDDADALILITPGLRALVDVSLLTKIKVVLFAQLAPTSEIASPIAPEMFTTTPRYLDYIQNDPLRLTHATARFYWQSSRLDSYIDRNINRLDIPLLLFLAGRDRIIDNAGVLELLQRASLPEFEVIDYPEQTHSVQFDDPALLVEDMDHWLKGLETTHENHPL
ncbi:MAG: alpha/beta fold hydrolase [Gammaproteobacteria bacterium]